MTDLERRPRICIAIPAYNAAKTLRATLDSIVSQDYDAWEVSAVDDGSTDDTSAILAEYAARDPRVHFVSQPNAGTGAALNTAFRNARAEFIAQFGADDELLPGYMATMAAFMDEHPGFDIYSCNAWILDEDGKRSLYARDPQQRPWISISFGQFLEGQPFFFAGGALIRGTLWERAGGFRADIFCEDVDFGRRVLAQGARHIYSPQALVLYRRDIAGQKTRDRQRILEGLARIDEDLLASGELTAHQTRLVRNSLARTRRRLAMGGTPDELAWRSMERQAQWLRRTATRLLGAKAGDRLLAVLRMATRHTHPLRRQLIRALHGLRAFLWRLRHDSRLGSAACEVGEAERVSRGGSQDA